jgi:hypothetical protein
MTGVHRRPGPGVGGRLAATGAGALALVPDWAAQRAVPDRLDMLTALIAAPSFDPLFRGGCAGAWGG